LISPPDAYDQKVLEGRRYP